MKINFDLVTTRTGDDGKSSDYSGNVDWKDAPVFEVLGDLDELTSWLGVIKHFGHHRSTLEDIQQKLLDVGSLIATSPASALFTSLRQITEADIDTLELWEKKMLDSGVVIRPVFVLPGATPRSARVDVARTVCRRVERRLVAFMRERLRPDLRGPSRYLNRLSDGLFVLARSFES